MFTIYFLKTKSHPSKRLLVYFKVLLHEYNLLQISKFFLSSAGAGRTGTFVGMFNLFDELDDTGKIDAQSAVLKMRESRKKMVQTLVRCWLANSFHHNILTLKFGLGS